MHVESAWAAFAVGAMLCLGLSDLLNKRAMRAGVRRTQFLVVQSYFFTITTLVLLPFVGGLQWSPELLFAIACGVITFS
jgi:drug/metabolite transporter (DMT)-like permease